MSADQSRPEIRRARPVEKKALPAGSARDLRDAVYLLYAEADRPQLVELAKWIAADNALPGAPGKDLIGKVISGDGQASQQDTVTVAVALARAAGRQGVAQLAEQVRRLWIAAATTQQSAPRPADRLGRPVDECDPFALEVHPAIRTSTDPVAVLPAYVSRAHDARLQEIVNGMLDDKRSRLVTLVGGSSTGKTRAGWELARYLKEKQPGRWRLWHPYDPTRLEAALAGLGQVSEYTIVWLNEAQFYLQPANTRLGERIAAGLRTLLQDRVRGPVLVLATLWPQYWQELTSRPEPPAPDPHSQARDLLAGSRIDVADRFTHAELAGLQAAGVDARLRQAGAHAEGGRVTQFLAGAPELRDRYRTASPAARAILQVAVDARRLGYPLALPHALLQQAAPGYLDDQDWDALCDDWLAQALAETARPCKGARGPLTRIRPRPGEPPLPGGQPCYRLTDYLEQVGRHERGGVYPPESLWRAFASTVTDPDLLRDLGRSAQARGRYQHAIWLYTPAAAHGEPGALRELAELRERAGVAGAEALYRQAADRGDTEALQKLAVLRKEAGDIAGAEALYRQAADPGDTFALRELAWIREQAGDIDGAEALYRQAADHGDTDGLRKLAMLRKEAGDIADAEALYGQAADRGDTEALLELAELSTLDTIIGGALDRHATGQRDTSALLKLAMLWEHGDTTGAEAPYGQAADRGDTSALCNLAELWEDGDIAGIEALYRQAADHGDTGVLRNLAELRDLAGDTAGAEALYRQAADRGDTEALRKLAMLRKEAGDTIGVKALAALALDCGDTSTLLQIVELLVQASDVTGAEVLLRQAADRGDDFALQELAILRGRVGDTTGATALAVQAAERGNYSALRELAMLQEWAGDITGAAALAVQGCAHGDIDALWHLALLREQAGDPDRADRMRRFGLTRSGEVATFLDFDSGV